MKIDPRNLVLPFITSLILIAVFVSSTPLGTAAGLTEVTWPEIETVLTVGGFIHPVYITHAGDGSGRLFIVEQPGSIQTYKNGQLPKIFLDITDRVRSVDSGGGFEEGLFSVAFPPGFGSTLDHFYVYYTNMSSDNQVSRFSMSADPSQADPASEELILYLDHPVRTNHNGGQLQFGPDGYLYIATGDGGGSGDPDDNSQDPASLLGKLLRIDVEYEVTPTPGGERLYLPLVAQSDGWPVGNYHIPPDNPFVGVPNYRPEIWALGLRNPWRFSFDRLTGELYIGDVGQSRQEEVDFQTAASPGGENYGWNIMEGTECYNSTTCDMTGLTLPIHTYNHSPATCDSVTGGYVYRGGDYPAMAGIYIFGDWCYGSIMGLQKDGPGWVDRVLLESSADISSFGEDESGELYFADHLSGNIYQIREVQTP